jgi:hypothetical protein
VLNKSHNVSQKADLKVTVKIRKHQQSVLIWNWVTKQNCFLLLTYKALHGFAPTHLSDLVLPYIPTRTLRSQDTGLLIVPKTSKQTAGWRAFSYSAPFLWNGLPTHVRDADSITTFKSLLKTHLFSRSYS